MSIDTFQSLDEDRNISPRARQLEQLLARKLAEFLDSCIPYTLRRILTAEVQHMYIGPGNSQYRQLDSDKGICWHDNAFAHNQSDEKGKKKPQKHSVKKILLVD